MWCQADGKYYQWHLDEAKTVAADSTPATTGGVGAGPWADRTQDMLRSELTDNNAFGLRVAVPFTATSSGQVGQWAADASYFYVCTSTNVWKRVAVSSW